MSSRRIKPWGSSPSWWDRAAELPVGRDEAERLPARAPALAHTVALEHDVIHAGPLELMADREAGLAGADHDDCGGLPTLPSDTNPWGPDQRGVEGVVDTSIGAFRMPNFWSHAAHARSSAGRSWPYSAAPAVNSGATASDWASRSSRSWPGSASIIAATALSGSFWVCV